MVYDFIDTSTKVSLVRFCRKLLAEDKSLSFQPFLDQISSMTQLFKPSDDKLMTLLKLISIGIITPVIESSLEKQTLKLNAKQTWQLPIWVTHDKACELVEQHIDWLLLATDNCDSQNVPSAIGDSMNSFRHHGIINKYPASELPNMEKDMAIIRTSKYNDADLLFKKWINVQKENVN
jgi:hypothetical protein